MSRVSPAREEPVVAPGAGTLAALPRAGHPPSDRSLVEALGLELDESMSLLGRVGLGEVFQFLTPHDRLSDGQQARARLAYTFARSVPSSSTSSLDSTATARRGICIPAVLSTERYRCDRRDCP